MLRDKTGLYLIFDFSRKRESTNNINHYTGFDVYVVFRISTLYQIFLPSRLIIKSR